jgi:hypothetical protein
LQLADERRLRSPLIYVLTSDDTYTSARWRITKFLNAGSLSVHDVDTHKIDTLIAERYSADTAPAGWEECRGQHLQGWSSGGAAGSVDEEKEEEPVGRLHARLFPQLRL